MASRRLTKRHVDEVLPGARETFLWDSDLKGFGLKVTPSGSKRYVYQYRLGGREAKTRRYTIGAHGSPWTPTTARAEAERLALLVAQGIDPATADKERRRQSVDLAFETYAVSFVQSCAGEGWARMVERSLRLHITPVLRQRTLSEIRRADVTRMLDRIPPGQLATRRNTFAVIRRLFRWAVSRGDLERSPCEGMETPRAVTPRDRVLKDAELRCIWRAADSAGKQFGPIVRLLIATGQRREEVSGLDWLELSRDAALWTLPKERSKNATAHRVPLNVVALGVLDTVAGTESWPTHGRVFPTSTGNQFTAHARGKRALDAVLAANEGAQGVPRWRLHDLRRTMATGFQKLGVRFEVTEASLNHLSGSRAGIAAIYQRYDWDAEKRAAFEAWSNHLTVVLHHD